ncbi:MAG TPA: LytTR family DNA-binding domain-containing protein [Gemmatimonadales bacterium]|jgi:two-component system LytT family response regulator
MSIPIRVLVVDDEPLARNGLVSLLRRDSEVEVVGECADGRAAVVAVDALDPDLVLLDVQMPEMDGFEVIRAVGPDRMPPVVFVTAYDQFAVRAFEVHALDYLLKPFDDERFRAALAHAKEVVRGGELGQLTRRLQALLGQPAAPVPPNEAPLERLVVKKPDTTLLVPVDEIDWIEAADYCVRIHAAGRVHVLRESMHRLEQRLDQSRFFRVHRSAIVNLDRVREARQTVRGEHVLVLQDGSRIRMSRIRRAALEERLGQAL